MIDPQEISTAWRALGRQLAELRRAAGHTQHTLAPLTLYGRSTVASAETGYQRPDRKFWIRCDQVLDTGGVLTAGYDHVVALERQRRRQLAMSGPATRRGTGCAPAAPGSGASPSAAFGADDDPPGVESPAAILSRIEQQATLATDDALLDAWELYIAGIPARYEQIGPAVLGPEVVSQRRRVQQRLTCWSPPRHSRRLTMIASQMSGLLSYMAVNLGRFDSARAYGVEAFQLATFADDDDLRAWIRGTESLAAYYAGRYDMARDLAVDGLRFARDGHQAVRLLVNGVARAQGKLGDQPAVDAAVGTAYERLSAFPASPGMSPCLSFGAYSTARVASNAATAYLALGRTAQVLDQAAHASTVADASASVWSQSLVRLDTATALVKAEHPDLEQATTLVRQAITRCADNRIESITQRTRACLYELAPWSQHPSVRELSEQARKWLSEESSIHG